MWQVESSDEYDSWFKLLDEESKEAVLERVLLLAEMQVKQSDMTNFTQSSVSKIEKRKDIKISTLIDYLDSLGMGVEIIAYTKAAALKKQEKVLLKV